MVQPKRIIIATIFGIIAGFIAVNFEIIMDFILDIPDLIWNQFSAILNWLIDNNNLLFRLVGYWFAGILIVIIIVVGIAGIIMTD